MPSIHKFCMYSFIWIFPTIFCTSLISILIASIRNQDQIILGSKSINNCSKWKILQDSILILSNVVVYVKSFQFQPFSFLPLFLWNSQSCNHFSAELLRSYCLVSSMDTKISYSWVHFIYKYFPTEHNQPIQSVIYLIQLTLKSHPA